MIEAGQVISKPNADTEATTVSLLDADLLDAVVRLVRLLDSPDEAKILMTCPGCLYHPLS
jgi:hypothetical protein